MDKPTADGNCGFRALAFELFGSKDRYVDVKNIKLLHYLKNVDRDYKNMIMIVLKEF